MSHKKNRATDRETEKPPLFNNSYLNWFGSQGLHSGIPCIGPNVLREHNLHDVGRAFVTSVRLLYWPKSHFSQTFWLELKNDPELQHIDCPPSVPTTSAEERGELCHLDLHQTWLNEDAPLSTVFELKTTQLLGCFFFCLVERVRGWKNLKWKLTGFHNCYTGDIPCTQITVKLTSSMKCWGTATAITIIKLEVRFVIALIILLIQIWTVETKLEKKMTEVRTTFQMWKLTECHFCYTGDVPCTQITVEFISVIKCWGGTTAITIKQLEVRFVISLIILFI